MVSNENVFQNQRNPNMNFKELSVHRFSARKFTEEAVSEADLDYVMECVRMAPSAVNKQPWKFLVVQSEAAKQRVRQAYDRPWFATAPLYVVCLKSLSEGWIRPCDGKAHADIDVAIATEHLCLAAAERGLGSCWVCNFDATLLRQAFPDEDGFEAVAIVPLGHLAADCPHGEKKRKPLSDIVQYV